jgi:acyl-CoA synthetase (AMP-forming)/AMP-acid ligase II
VDVVATHPDVDQVAVIAVPDEIWGEKVHAVIVLREGALPSPRSVIQYCRLHMAGYKVPRSIAFVDGLPLSPAGKVQKNVLRDMAVQEKW